MSQNPFQTPAAPDPFQAAPAGAFTNDGRIDLGQAISDAWHTMTSNAGLAIGGMLLTMVLMFFGYITIIGILLILPVVGYGAVRFLLNLADGRAEIGDLFDGFRNYGTALGSMLLLFLIFLGLALPTYILIGLSIWLEQPALSMLAQLVNLVMAFTVGLRLYFAPFFIVDQGMGGIEAVKAAWAATSGQYVIVLALALVAGIIMMVGLLAFIVGFFFTLPMGYLIYVHAYRQMAGG